MAAKRPVLSAEDQALFLEAVGGARPLNGRDRLPVPPPPPAVGTRGRVAPGDLSSRSKATAIGYAARAPGVSRAQVAELRAGKVHAEVTLDLHGDPSTKATRPPARVPRSSRAASAAAACSSIHGRGLHSEHGAPLREAVLADLLGAALRPRPRARRPRPRAMAATARPTSCCEGRSEARRRRVRARPHRHRAGRCRAARSRAPPREDRRHEVAPSCVAPTARRRRRPVGELGELRPAREVSRPPRRHADRPRTRPRSRSRSCCAARCATAYTGLFVADARTGEPLFAVNADDPLNPASNVKMISTATALELLGPTSATRRACSGPSRRRGVDPRRRLPARQLRSDARPPPTSTTSRAAVAAARRHGARRRHRRRQRSDARRHVPRDHPDRDHRRRARRGADARARRSALDLVTINVTAKTAKTRAAPAPDVHDETSRTTRRPTARRP